MDTEFLKKLDLTPMRLLKMAGVVLVAIILISLVLQVVGGTPIRIMTGQVSSTVGMSAPATAYSGNYAYDVKDSSYGYSYGTKGEMASGMPSLSVRNVSSIALPSRPSPTGDTAEQFEVTQYSATIETRHLESTCDTVSGLKALDYVIFDSSNAYDRGCNFTFKVKHKNVDEILGIIKGLDPKELSENTYTIKQQIDDFTSEVEVLTKKRASIDQTLASALSAYDEITTLATRTQNAEALAQIIDSRIRIIERLTQERIAINEQLDRLSRAKADQLDRLDYTTFGVNVYENKFVDGEQLADSWKAAIKSFVQDLNKIVQDLTVNLVLLGFFVLQWALYAFIVLIVAKYGWALAKYVWRR